MPAYAINYSHSKQFLICPVDMNILWDAGASLNEVNITDDLTKKQKEDSKTRYKKHKQEKGRMSQGIYVQSLSTRAGISKRY